LKINRVFDEKKPKNEYFFFSDSGTMSEWAAGAPEKPIV
jgi:hypothetical protein